MKIIVSCSDKHYLSYLAALRVATWYRQIRNLYIWVCYCQVLCWPDSAPGCVIKEHKWTFATQLISRNRFIKDNSLSASDSFAFLICQVNKLAFNQMLGLHSLTTALCSIALLHAQLIAPTQLALQPTRQLVQTVAWHCCCISVQKQIQRDEDRSCCFQAEFGRN